MDTEPGNPPDPRGGNKDVYRRIIDTINEKITLDTSIHVERHAEKLRSPFWTRKNLSIRVKPSDYHYIVGTIEKIHNKILNRLREKDVIKIVEKIINDKQFEALAEIRAIKKLLKVEQYSNFFERISLYYDSDEKCFVAYVEIGRINPHTIFHITPYGSVITRQIPYVYTKHMLAVGLVNDVLLYVLARKFEIIYGLIMPDVDWL
ncbi:MAG: hypothetical protein QXT13_07650 [Pyrobaculum sp.]